MQEHYLKWYTQYLSRDFEMLVFGHDGYPVILFPTLNGRYYENKDYGLIDSASHFIEKGKIKFIVLMELIVIADITTALIVQTV